ncbi:phosphatase PAP2 family protein [Chitinophaga defluvii]|uniref:Phosphatase PAP2 family protein n=1 Tax=Chitinophaga defluvii TaxID=3163343 RepID=A0ABV2T790_9BACT
MLSLLRKNAYFFLPFLLWVIAGGILFSKFTKEELFLSVNQAHAPWADVLVTGITYLGDGISFAILLVVLLIMKKFRLFFMGLATFLLVTVVVQVAKHALNAPRPISYFEDTSIIHTVKWVTVHGSNSFPSGHTAGAFGMFCFLAIIVANKRLGLLFMALALGAAHSRLYLAQHFYADVYVGSIIGTLSAVLVCYLFQLREKTTASKVCPQPAAGNVIEAT